MIKVEEAIFLLTFAKVFFLPSLSLFFMKYSLKAKYGARMRFINNTMKCKDGTGYKGRTATVRELRKKAHFMN